MKQIVLNSQGILDIQDPRKTYIMKSTCLNDSEVQYSTPFKEGDVWIFIRIDNINPFVASGKYYIITYGTYYLQYLLEKALIKAEYDNSYDDNLYQFNSIEEFQKCYAEGLL
jgi:hypothetical protein